LAGLDDLGASGLPDAAVFSKNRVNKVNTFGIFAGVQGSVLSAISGLFDMVYGRAGLLVEFQTWNMCSIVKSI
jgi:hypothetical protein